MRHDAHAIVEAFGHATMGMTGWSQPLGMLAAATRARAGQIAAIDGRRGLFVNLLSGTSVDEEQDYIAAGGPDPAVNPRTRVAIEGALHRCVVDDQYVTAADRARLPIYTGLFTRNDIPHSCIVPLGTAPDGVTMALALLRPRSSGVADARDIRLIEAVAPAIATAISASLTMGTAIDAGLVRTAENLSGPSILLGLDRTVASLSPAAEAIVRTGQHLAVRHGRLVATGADADAALDRAFRSVSGEGGPRRGAVPVALRPRTGRAPLIVDLCPLPTRIEGPLSAARALLTIRVPRVAPDADRLLTAAFGLTAAEAAVALLLAQGHAIVEIAERRGASAGTVRNQVKALFEKTGTRRQPELVLAIRPFC